MWNPLRPIFIADEWLLDHVFQPVVDRLYPTVDGFSLAQYSIDGLAACLLLQGLIDFRAGQTFGGFIMLLVIPMYGIMRFIQIPSHRRMAAYGGRNRLRIYWFPLRMVGFSILGFDAVFFWLLGVWHPLLFVRDLFYITMAYFESCDIPPPKPKRVSFANVIRNLITAPSRA